MPTVYLESASTDPTFNLALEQYVFDSLPRDRTYLMLWQNDNAIIVGKHQNTVEEINPEYVRAHGIRVVRRLSGGGAVYHDLGNLNFTVITDAKGAETLNFQMFCRPVVRALAELGVQAEVSGRNDITIDGKKFSGNSQYVREERVMHHGTLLFDSDLSVVASALRVSDDKVASNGVKSVRGRITNIRDHLPPEVGMAQFRGILRRHLAEGSSAEPYALTAADLAAVEVLRRSRYGTWEWNFGTSPSYSIRKTRRVEGCGGIEVRMEVSGGVITAFATYGDYFGSGDTADIARVLIGRRPEEAELLSALSGLPVGYYYHNLTARDLAEIILL